MNKEAHTRLLHWMKEKGFDPRWPTAQVEGRERPALLEEDV
jgi:hypothetical protein